MSETEAIQAGDQFECIGAPYGGLKRGDVVEAVRQDAGPIRDGWFIRRIDGAPIEGTASLDAPEWWRRLPRPGDSLEERRRGLVVGEVVKSLERLQEVVAVGQRWAVNNSGRQPFEVRQVVPSDISGSVGTNDSWVRHDGVTFLGWSAPATPAEFPKADPKPAPKALPFRRHPECDLHEIHKLPRMCLGCESRLGEATEGHDREVGEHRYVTRHGQRPLAGPPSPMNFGPHSDTYRHALPYGRNRGR